MNLTSNAFAHNGAIPKKHTCDGGDVSPPLSWSGVPPGAKSLVLVVDDPDAPDPAAPKMTWVHWVLYNLPPSSGGLAEGYDADLALVDPAKTWTIRAQDSPSTQGYTPFEGIELTARVKATFLRGMLVCENGKLLGPPRGQYLHRPT